MTAEASALMQRGIALLNANTPASLAESLGHFEAAIALRRRSRVIGDPWAAYLLAASWMNHGDALTRLGGSTRLEAALRSYDEALAALREVPPDANPLYRRRHAIAWINRGLTLYEQGTDGSLRAAVRSFERGIAETRDHPEHAVLLAGAWVNHGKALLRLRPVRATEARGSAVNALEQVQHSEEHDPLAAETGLKARLLLCQAVAEQLPDESDPQTALDLVCVATDAVETGLPLARSWEGRADAFLAALAADLFRYGLAAYRRYQPQFLSEFVAENLPGCEDLASNALAAEALNTQTHCFPPDGFASLHTPRFARLLETLRILHLAKDRLRDLSQKAHRDLH